MTYKNKLQIKGAAWLTAIIVLIFAGFASDNSTEYGHHALFIIAGLLCGIGIAAPIKKNND